MALHAIVDERVPEIEYFDGLVVHPTIGQQTLLD